MRYANLLWASLLSGCSLTSLVDLELRTCKEGSDPKACNESVCQPLNEAEKIDISSACDVYQYAEGGGCVLSARDWDGDGFIAADCTSDAAKKDCDDSSASSKPGASEVCEPAKRVDENCDGVIDEGVFAGTSAGQLSSESLKQGLLRFAADQSAFAVVAPDRSLESSEPPKLVNLLDGKTTDIIARGFAKSDVDVPPETELAGMAGLGCPAASGEVLGGCTLREAVIAGAPEARLMVAIDKQGCDRGIVRVGYLEGDTFAQRGPLSRSNIFRGVVGEGGSRCSESGATRPNVALADRSVGSAIAGLVVWLAGPQSAGCGGETAVDVMALGVWLETDPFAPTRRWVNAANNGVPVVIGRTKQGSAPAAIHLNVEGEDSHFLVSFRASESERLVLSRITVPKSPVYIAMPRAPEQARETPAITVGASIEVVRSEGADAPWLSAGVSLSDACGEPGRELVLSFRKGCGTINAEQQIVKIGAPDGDLPCVRGAAISLGELDDRRNPPPAVALHDEDAMITSASERANGSEQTGGYVVAFTSGKVAAPSVALTRVLDVDGQVLDQVIARQNGTSPLLYRDSTGRMSLAYRDADADRLRTRALYCAL